MNVNQRKVLFSVAEKRGRPVGSKNRLSSIKKQKINNKVDNPSERAAKGLATFTINEQYATDTV